MKAGWMRERVTILTLVQSKDSEGGNVKRWEDVVTVSAGVESLSGGKRAATKAGGGEYGFGMYEVTIRYRPGLSRSLRLEWGGVLLEVMDVRNPQNRNESLVLTCKEGQRGNS